MKHLKLFFLLAAVCLSATMRAASYQPKGSVCKFFYTFEFDKAFIFENEGTSNCSYSQYRLQSSPGTIAMCLMSFNNYTGGYYGHDYDLRSLTVALDDKTRQTYIHIFNNMQFTPERTNDTEWDLVFKDECEPILPADNKYFKYHFVQKRVDQGYDDGSKFIYLNVEYTEEARQFITQAGSSLALHVYGNWRGNTLDNWKYYDSGVTLVNPPAAPEISSVEWENYANKTGFRYNVATENNTEIQAQYSYNNVVKHTDVFAQRSSKQMHASPLDWAYTTKDTAQIMNACPWVINVQARRGTLVNTSFYMKNHGYPSTTYLYSPVASAQTSVYNQATQFTVVDKQNGTVELTWQVPTASSSQLDESGWVLERRVNKGNVTYLRQDYVNSQSSYSMLDNLVATGKGVQTYSYTLYRAHSNAAYGPKKTASCDIQTNYLNVSGLNAKQVGTTSRAEVSWRQEPGIWNDADMTITLSYSDGTTTNEVNIPKGTTSYTVDMKPCTPYTIQVQVKKGNVVVSQPCKLIDYYLASGVPSIIKKVSISKGFYNDRVRVGWTIDNDGQNFTFYKVQRKPHLVHDSVYSAIHTVQHTQGVLEYAYFDNEMVPGAYYDYCVIGYSKCNSEPQAVAKISEVGFAQNYGVVSGQITYEGNQGVKNVEVQCIGEGNRTNRSLYINGDSIKAGKEIGKHLFGTEEGAIECMFCPYGEPKSVGHLMNWMENFNFSYMGKGILRAWMRINPSQSVEVDIPYTKAVGYTTGSFVHVLCTYRLTGQRLLVEAYANGKKVQSVTQTLSATDHIMAYPNADFCLADGFVGWLDEIRCWNTYRDSASIAKTYNSYLSGKENGLTAYYRCDDDVSGHLFDISMTGSTFNERHLRVQHIQTDAKHIPTPAQLSLKAMTDDNGNYLINAIPFGANGTLYQLTPTMGEHEFAPRQKPLFFSSSSTTSNNIDFTDMSSFSVTGRVTYDNTNFPVSGCMFKVDGIICTQNGQPVLSDDNGVYTISVPIGNHYITVEKNGHVFKANGRYPAQATHSFIEPLTDIHFYDITTVLLAGRVAGGVDESNKPFGFGEGKANIGRAVITIAPPAGMYDLNLDVNNPRIFLMPDSIPCRSRTTTGKKSGDLARKITIVTDSATGEFYAALPPINFEVTDITIPANRELKIDVAKLGKISLADNYPSPGKIDSIRKSDKTVNYFRYYQALNVTHYVEPTLEVVDHRNRPGMGEAYYYKPKPSGQGVDTIALRYKDASGKIVYTYGYPCFNQGQSYVWDIRAFENYINFDKANKPDTTRQPMRRAIVTITNELGHKVLAEKDTSVIYKRDTTSYKKGEIIEINDSQILLDDQGAGQYVFVADQPNIVTPYTYGVNINYEDNAHTRFYAWELNTKFKGIVFGNVTSGSNFITQGVDMPTYILRDPPGAQSTASIAKDSSFTTSAKTSHGFTYNFDENFQFNIGFHAQAGAGLGVIAISSIDAPNKIDLSLGFNGEVSKMHSSEFVSTLTQTVSTQGDINYVGTMGDVYIGESTNFLYGNARRLTLRRNSQGKYELAVDDVTALKTQFATTFNYSQRYIEEDLLPNFEKLRNALLVTVPKEQYDTTYPPHPTKDLYITTLDKSDKRFGSSNNDTTVWGKQAVGLDVRKGPSYIFIPSQVFASSSDKVRQDMVFFYNQQIKLWKTTMAQNEYAKSIVHGSNKLYDDELWKKAIKKAEEAANWRTRLRNPQEKACRQVGDITICNREYLMEDYAASGCDSAKLSPLDYYKGGWLLKNISFDAGATVEAQSVTTSSTGLSRVSDNSQSFAFKHSVGFEFNKTGFVQQAEFKPGHHSNDESGTTQSSTITTKFTLQGNDFEALSVDVYQDPLGFGPIFATRGGQTYCPYEKEEKTKYYEPDKHVLHDATINMEQPEISVENPSVVNIPTGDAALYTATLVNKADVNTSYSTWMHLYLDDNSNKYGAQVLVDGAPLTGSGRDLKMYPKQPMQKTIVIKQSRPDILQYDSIAVILSQACLPYEVADTIFLSAHFVQACSPVTISAKNYTINTSTGDTADLTISGYNATYANFAGIRVQYAREGDNNWHLVKAYTKAEIGNAPSLYLSVPMRVPDYTDGNYLFRAVTVCKYGNDEIVNESLPIVLVRDMNRPTSLGLPTPINGIYTMDNEITVTLNENIQKGKIIPDNVTVKGMLNAHDLKHEVALQMGNKLKAATEAQVNISSREFSAEMWFRSSGTATLLQHGAANGLTLQMDDKGYILVQMPNVDGDMQQIQSTIALPKDTWVYLLLTLKDESNTSSALLNVYAAYGDKDMPVIANQKVAAYRKSAPLLVGCEGLGNMHELMLWSKVRDWTIAKSECNRSKEQYSASVIGYWPMNEGYGTVAKDILRHRNLSLGGESWWLSGDNHALRVTPNHPDTAMVGGVLRADENTYALEMWTRLDGDGEICRTLDNQFAIEFAGKNMRVRVDSTVYTITTNLDLGNGQWRHLTFAGEKNSSTNLYINGKRLESPLQLQFPDITNTALLFGKQNAIDMDEVRIWSASISESWLSLYRYCQLGDSAMSQYPGLVYYNSCNVAFQGRVLASTAAPLRVDRKVSTVQHKVTSSDNKLVINITEPISRIEGCTLEFTVKDLIDLNGNFSMPIVWTAFVNRNQLVWSETDMSVIKENLESASLYVDVMNNSGQVENWTVSGAPEWLTFSQTRGITQPLSVTHLSAAIDPSLAIGSYEGVVYLTGNQGLAAPLYVSVLVTGDEPEWRINPADFEHSMNLIAVVTKNNMAVANGYDMVAAFSGNQVVGVTHPQYISSHGKYYVMMDIYSKEDANAGDITFRYWQASTGSVYSDISIAIDDDEPVTSLEFKADKVYGSTAKPIRLILSNRMDLSVQLDKGWNWVSFNVLDSAKTLSEQLNGLIPAMRMIKSNSLYAEAKKDQLLGTLKQLDFASAYKIHATKYYAAYISGYPADATLVKINLKPQCWNWIGYVPQMSLNINTALANLNPSEGDVIKAQSGFATWNGVEWIGSLSTMCPGVGYLYYNASTSPQTFCYPSNAVLTNFAPVMRKTSESVFMPVDPTDYQGNMTITAKVMDGETEVTDAEVGIFVGDECRAAATYLDLNEESEGTGAYFILVPGEESVPLTIMVARDDKVVVVEQDLIYKDDAMVGSLTEPYIIQLNEDTRLDNAGFGATRQPYKLIKNGILYIVHDGKVFTADGAEVQKM